jgi:anti-anti-sigma regulatory factor
VTQENAILIGIFDGFSWIRCAGRGSFLTSPALKACIDARIDDGERCAVVDLSACSGMDSTFMGTLAGLSTRLKKRGGKLQVADPGEKNRHSLVDLGLHHLFEVDPPEAIWRGHEETVRSRLQPFTDVKALGQMPRAEHVLEAHKILSAANEENARKFSGVVRLLEEQVSTKPEPKE